ncbi:hypothetical protein BGZ81_006993 [Podila clonocystis]|nr:hypothetical protein BGZ81_006993 [Podila clonocystis]
MVIRLQASLACFAVTQDSMYAVTEGLQSNGDRESLLTLIKAQYPTMAAKYNIWTVVSTTPIKYFPAVPNSGWTYDLTCDVDRNGVVTLRSVNGAGYRYDPLAPKISMAQTCSADNSGHGEWKRTDLVDSESKILGLGLGDPRTLDRFFIQEEDSTSTTINNSNGNQDEREAVVYYSRFKDSVTPLFFYTVFNKMAYRSDITDFNEFALVLASTWPSPPEIPTRLYIHDSKMAQTREPFQVANVTDVDDAVLARMLPVYSSASSQQQEAEPQFLVINSPKFTLKSYTIDLRALDGPPQEWIEFLAGPKLQDARGS